MKRVLFIGGCRDGGFYEMAELPPHLEVLSDPKPSAARYSPGTQVAAVEALTKELYRRREFVSPGSVRYIYVPVEMTDTEMLGVLIDGYRPCS